MSTRTVDLDTDVPGLNQIGTSAQELGALKLTHLGWADYVGNGLNRATVWQVNSLAYYDTATIPEAFTPNADYNHNGVVDAADYIVWRKNLNATGSPGTVPGDGTSNDLIGVPDGDVDQFDYSFWSARFGLPAGSGGASGLVSASVPEPASLLLLTGVLSILLSAQRFRCS